MLKDKVAKGWRGRGSEAIGGGERRAVDFSLGTYLSSLSCKLFTKGHSILKPGHNFSRCSSIVKPSMVPVPVWLVALYAMRTRFLMLSIACLADFPVKSVLLGHFCLTAAAASSYTSAILPPAALNVVRCKLSPVVIHTTSSS